MSSRRWVRRIHDIRLIASGHQSTFGTRSANFCIASETENGVATSRVGSRHYAEVLKLGGGAGCGVIDLLHANSHAARYIPQHVPCLVEGGDRRRVRSLSAKFDEIAMRSANAGLLSILALVVAIAGCGSDTGEDPAVALKAVIAGAEGGWSGYSDNADMVAVILENGEYWSIDSNSPSADAGGFVQGSITIGLSSGFTVEDARGFSDGGTPEKLTVNAALKPKVSILRHALIAGTMPQRRWDFGLTPMATTQYRYDLPASVADALGLWGGRFWDSSWEGLQLGSGPYDRAGTPISVVVANDGSFSGTVVACTFNGAIRPRASGKNIFDATISVAAANASAVCPDAGMVASGIGLLYRLQDGRQRLVVAARNADRTIGVVFFADR